MAKRVALIWIVTVVTLVSGVVNLYSAIHPPAHAHHPLLRGLLPLEFFYFPRSITLLTGLALIVSAINISRRNRRAWQLVMALSSLSLIFHLLRGHNHEQALLSAALMGMLIALRGSFTVKSRPPDWRAGLSHIAVSFVAAFGYGVAGFWLLDKREFGIDFNLLDSVHRTLLYLALIGDSSLVPRTRYAEWFLVSLYAMTIAVIGYGVWSLFRPILYRFHLQPQERARAKEILNRHGRSSLDFFKLWPDKSYFYNSTNEAFIAYRVGLNFAIALADPVGPERKIEETIALFRQYCEDNGWGLAFYQTLPDFLPIYQKLGFKKLRIGDEALVDLTRFTLSGSAMKRLRQKTNQLEKAGFQVKRYQAPLSDELIRQLKEVSDEWLQIPGRRERTFALGMFEPSYVRSSSVMTAEDGKGEILAFVNFIHSYCQGEATVDLMRHRADTPNGIMDYLFIKLFQDCRERGFVRFSLGLAPLDGFQGREGVSSAEMAVFLFLNRLNFIFSFSGVKKFKAKYADFWQPRYVLYRSVFDLPKLGLALSRISELGTVPRLGRLGSQGWMTLKDGAGERESGRAGDEIDSTPSITTQLTRPPVLSPKAVIGYLLALAGLIWALYDLKLPEMFSRVTRINWGWIALAILFDVLSYLTQGKRWQLLLKPVGEISILHSTQAVYAGLFANEILPLRPGELVRAWIVSRRIATHLVTVMPSILVERLLDGVCLAVGTGLTAIFVPLPKDLLRAAETLGIIVVIATVTLFYRVLRTRKAPEEKTQIEGMSGKIPGFVSLLIEKLADGLHGIGRTWAFYWSFACSFLLQALQALAFWLVMLGYGLHLSFWIGMAVFLIVNLGTAIPNAPANAGSYQFFCIVGLTLFGVDKTTAAGFSLVVFTLLTLPLLLLGSIAFGRSGATLMGIRRKLQGLTEV